MASRTSLRTIFDQVALDYEAVRPSYPKELIADVISISAIPEGGRILEVGCGTGQATILFAQRGYSMLCLDIGEQMTAMTHQKCQAYPKVSVKTIAFEDWEAQPATFDLVISATAFHWIAPEIGYAKAATVLKDSGHFAMFTNYHPTPYTGFFRQVQQVYRRVVPEWGDPSDSKPSTDDKIKATADYIQHTGLFEALAIKRYLWSKPFTADEYIRLLNTFSDHRHLDEARRNQLFRGIHALIREQYDGLIARPYLSVLYIAKKKKKGLFELLCGGNSKWQVASVPL